MNHVSEVSSRETVGLLEDREKPAAGGVETVFYQVHVQVNS
jgi:hypothetical protein